MTRSVMIFTAVVFASLAAGAAVGQQKTDTTLSAEATRGKYVIQIGGCNDCHTPGYTASGGKVEEKLWLTGNVIGFRGPWGTTYAANLRLLVTNMTADQFMIFARTEYRPPMPWFNMRDMSDRDVKAIFAYLKHVGPAGQPAPSYLPPDQVPSGPVVQFPAPPE